jgi:uncharacterized protein (TIGR02266 family)
MDPEGASGWFSCALFALVEQHSAMLIDRSFAEILPGADASADPTERRAAPRVAIETDVTIGGHGRVQSGVSLDVSMGGLFVATYAPLPVGTRVSLRFRLPTGTVVATGSVRWVRDPRPGRIAGVGIELTEMSDDDRETLRRFCGNRPRFLSYEEIVAGTH